jgi:hypothetical protein
MKAEETFALRRSVQPYVTLGAIFGGVAIWALVLAYRKLDRGTAESAVLLLAFYAAYVVRRGSRRHLGLFARLFFEHVRRNPPHVGVRCEPSALPAIGEIQAMPLKVRNGSIAASTRQMTPRTTSRPTNRFWVMIELLGALAGARLTPTFR